MSRGSLPLWVLPLAYAILYFWYYGVGGITVGDPQQLRKIAEIVDKLRKKLRLFVREIAVGC